jgi:tetratricopeptide (TPR) repeat protein
MALFVLSSISASEFERLKMVEGRGIKNADLYYNLGVTYWQIGQSGMANLYFLKALNLDSAHKSAKENLNYAIALSPDREIYPQRGFLLRLFYEIYDFMNLNRIAALSLVLLVISAILLSWTLHYNPQKERDLPILILSISLFLLIVSSAFLSVKAYRQIHNSKAVLLIEQAELREEADLDSKRVAVIHEGIIMDIIDCDGDWLLLQLPDGNSGWLEAAAIGRVVEKY